MVLPQNLGLKHRHFLENLDQLGGYEENLSSTVIGVLRAPQRFYVGNGIARRAALSDNVSLIAVFSSDNGL